MEHFIPKLVARAEALAESVITGRQENDAATGSALVREAVQQSLRLAEATGLSSEEAERSAVAVWLYFTALEKGSLFVPKEEIQSLASNLLSGLGLSEQDRHQILQAILSCLEMEPKSTFEEVVCDAVNSIFLKARRLRDFTQTEMLLYKVIADRRVSWLRLLNVQLQRIRFFTSYGREEMAPKLEQLMENLHVYRKNMEREHRQELMQEFNLSKKDLKKLKKLSKRDDRGIQTLFRLTSRNHFTLNAMVDRKANIMISINAIILSIMIGGLIGGLQDAWEVQLWPAGLLIITSALSIIFAVFSIRPEVSHGEFTRDQLREKKGNLLFYGNFLKVSLNDYEREMLQLLNDSNYLYLSMIRDIYYLGETLNKKNRLLRISLNIFLVGIILAVLLLGLMQLLPTS